jgi:hypothetical protein
MHNVISAIIVASLSDTITTASPMIEQADAANAKYGWIKELIYFFI